MTGPTADAGLSFPRQYARTRRFSLGQPRSFHVAEDGSRISFLRSASGTDPLTSLWAFDLDTMRERLVCDPGTLGADESDLPPEERARRERARESAAGIVAYDADPRLRTAVFTLSGRLFAADLRTGDVRTIAAAAPAVEARIDPTGSRVAYVANRALRVVELDGTDRVLAAEDDPEVSWGLAEFVAQEEMGRAHGHWWAPDGSALLAARVDESPVARWTIADPANPDRPATVVRYPAAGTADAAVTLSILPLDGAPVPVRWDHEAFPSLVRALWHAVGGPTLLVQSRDQRRRQVLVADPETGETRAVRDERDEVWLEAADGAPDWLADGRLVHVAPDADTHRLFLGDEPVTPPGLQVRAITHVGADEVLFVASSEPTESHAWRVSGAGELTALTGEPGVHAAGAGGDVTVIVSSTLHRVGADVAVLRGGEQVATIASLVERPVIEVAAEIRRLGPRGLRSVVLLPREGDGPFPVLLDPYGGPHAQRVIAARQSYLLSRWWADQGFAVVIADGRGTPWRGIAWEQAVRGDLATAVLEDQIDALHAAAEADPRLDLGRVAIRGWSFGGYLAALAVLRRPDVFHAASAGAPVTDWALYDTFYTERYLGHPAEDPEAYRRSSLLDDAPRLERPLLLIHGLADDNVVVAHTLRLSGALLAAGRPHTVLPLTGITHMASSETVAENLLRFELDFLRRALGPAT